mmetsp:Transcript_12281/g.28806  ORF Transcript_12281/g.28806 Transcript_12281/m.28806 type:complete len:245 (-) Transcript_12281:238-972(-)
MRCKSNCGGSFSSTAVRSSADFCRTILDLLFAPSAPSSRTFRWWKAHRPSTLPVMPQSLSRARRLPRFFFSIPRSSSRTSRQTNSSLMKVLSTALTQSSRLSAKMPRIAEWIAFGSGASAAASLLPGPLTQRLCARASEWMVPVSRKSSWIQDTEGKSGTSRTHFCSKASCGTSAEASNLLTTCCSSSRTKGSPCDCSCSLGTMHGSSSACSERNHVISLKEFTAFPGAAGPSVKAAIPPSTRS